MEKENKALMEKKKLERIKEKENNMNNINNINFLHFESNNKKLKTKEMEKKE